jgi:hypothetical protein
MARWSPNELCGDGESIGLISTDREEAWHIRLEPDGFAWEPVEADATVTVSAPTELLFLALFGRRPTTDSRVTIAGDDARLARRLEASAL